MMDLPAKQVTYQYYDPHIERKEFACENHFHAVLRNRNRNILAVAEPEP